MSNISEFYIRSKLGVITEPIAITLSLDKSFQVIRKSSEKKYNNGSGWSVDRVENLIFEIAK